MRLPAQDSAAAAGVGVLGIMAVYGTLLVTNQQAQIALDTLHSQRPYVTLEKADGTVAEYKPPAKGKEKGVVAHPAPIDGFTATTMECLIGFFPRVDPSELIRGREYRAELLPRCEQPEERAVRDQAEDKNR